MTLESLLLEIQSAPLPKRMTTRIVAVDGHGGSGKSTFASKLSVALGNVPIIHTDDFASADNPIDWWPRLKEQVLEPLSKNETAHYQRYDWDNKMLQEWHDVEPTSYVVLEGVTSSRKEFRPYLSFSMWVDTPKEICIQRGLERDGYNSAEQWEKWWQAEQDYIDEHNPQNYVDVTIDGTKELA